MVLRTHRVYVWKVHPRTDGFSAKAMQENYEPLHVAVVVGDEERPEFGTFERLKRM
jgi:hypothetical protein